MKKTDIETRYVHGSRLPCVNVKARNMPHACDIAEHFGCSEEQAQKALEFAFDSACSQFWEQVDETVDYHLKRGKAQSDGRSSGWLVIHDLPDVETWDAIMVSKWSRFADSIRKEVKYLCSAEYMIESIEANQWHKDGSEQYNFIDRKDGTVACLADLKADAIKAGFSAVVRK